MSKKSNNPLDHVRVKQRGSSWAYYFEKAKVDGKRRRGEGGGYATEQDALMAGVEAYNAYIGGGAKKNDAGISFADYLDIWYERTRLYARNNTLELREKNIRLHIKPALGEYRLSSLSPASLIGSFSRSARTAMPMRLLPESSATSPRHWTMRSIRWNCYGRILHALSRCRAKSLPRSVIGSRVGVSRTMSWQ